MAGVSRSGRSPPEFTGVHRNSPEFNGLYRSRRFVFIKKNGHAHRASQTTRNTNQSDQTAYEMIEKAYIWKVNQPEWAGVAGVHRSSPEFTGIHGEFPFLDAMTPKYFVQGRRAALRSTSAWGISIQARCLSTVFIKKSIIFKVFDSFQHFLMILVKFGGF
jgi:hypothetical protein